MIRLFAAFVAGGLLALLGYTVVVEQLAPGSVSITSTSASKRDSKPTVLKTPVAFSTNLPALGSPILNVAERLHRLSGGALELKIFEPGKLVAPFEILDAVSSGKVEAGYATAGYWAGKIPASSLFSAIPFGPEAGEYMAWFYQGHGLKLYQQMYDQYGYEVKVLPCAIIAPETSGWFTKAIDRPEDLKGMRMRFFGLGGRVMQKLGVSTSLLPGGEIFGALEKGVIDATEFSMPAIDERLGFYKVAKYNYFPGWHQQATVFELLVNKQVWNHLSATHQTMIESACQASMADSFALGEAIQYPAIKRNMLERGVINKYWSVEMLRLFKKTWYEVVSELKLTDPFFARVWFDLDQFRSNYAVWQSYAFLPRELAK